MAARPLASPPAPPRRTRPPTRSEGRRRPGARSESRRRTRRRRRWCRPPRPAPRARGPTPQRAPAAPSLTTISLALAEHLGLALVRQQQVDLRDRAGADQRPRGRVDRHRHPRRLRPLDRGQRARAARRRAAARSPPRADGRRAGISGNGRVVGARVGQHRPLAAGLDEHDAGAGRPLAVDVGMHLHAGRRRAPRPRGGRAGRRRPGTRTQTGVPSAAAHAATLAADPPPATLTCAGVSLPRASGPDDAGDDVDHEVAEDDERHAVARAICAASAALRSISRTFASRLAPPVSRWKRVEQERRDVLAADPARLGAAAEALAQDASRAARRRAGARSGWRPRSRRARAPRARARRRRPPRASRPATGTGKPESAR